MKQPDKTMEYYESSIKKRSAGSVTAEGVALIRATESAKPKDERICYDPYAVRFIRPEILAHFRDIPPEQREADRAAYDQEFPGQRNSIASRVRFFDDTVRKEIAGGIRQVIILGAGYDSRAYRIEGIRQARVFEIDRAELQDVKKAMVVQIFGSLPSHVTYLPLDLSTSSIFTALIGAGFDRTQRAVVIMEGLLYYLPPPRVRDLLWENACKAEPGSSILFDYLDQSVVDGIHPSAIAQNIRRHVAAVGEPFLFGMPKEGAEAFLSEFGYRIIRNVSNREYLRELFPENARGMETTGLLRFCHAETYERKPGCAGQIL
ncbi:class I SAM-dependent methyltransferase [Methanoregula sp.]|uniref:class I SAM-dependent methyltransferase n=1 Tax=Methanoregula sp. TaxID=2052170 RepID=UPI002370146F|nr:class I SAM-dependent methyltransferase [Methanoregula sp.]MDD1685740.1 class I SAM-dependent methyltransferase [Methanoregula sp.]